MGQPCVLYQLSGVRCGWVSARNGHSVRIALRRAAPGLVRVLRPVLQGYRPFGTVELDSGCVQHRIGYRGDHRRRNAAVLPSSCHREQPNRNRGLDRGEGQTPARGNGGDLSVSVRSRQVEEHYAGGQLDVFSDR
uniref:(northern house mosquito) hypothetical protein n=1 Tax=Culex pipiens TaxID=7175 RepID=A0A8D8E1C9_CULPI